MLNSERIAGNCHCSNCWRRDRSNMPTDSIVGTLRSDLTAFASPRVSLCDSDHIIGCTSLTRLYLDVDHVCRCGISSGLWRRFVQLPCFLDTHQYWPHGEPIHLRNLICKHGTKCLSWNRAYPLIYGKPTMPTLPFSRSKSPKRSVFHLGKCALPKCPAILSSNWVTFTGYSLCFPSTTWCTPWCVQNDAHRPCSGAWNVSPSTKLHWWHSQWQRWTVAYYPRWGSRNAEKSWLPIATPPHQPWVKLLSTMINHQLLYSAGFIRKE